ncbi:MAG TPA: hypothetical protein VGM83_18345 [Devosiaceae bacterium]|jgi:hypothetical protein
MRTLASLLAASALVASISPVFAQDNTATNNPEKVDAAAASAPEKPWTVVIDNYFTTDSTHETVSNHEIDVTVEAKTGDWTVGAEGWAGFTGDFTDDDDSFELENPTMLLYGESDSFGRIELFDADDALYSACVLPTPETTHFDAEDVMTFNTCSGYSGGQAITYTTPTLGDGFKIKGSLMGDLTNAIDSGSVDSSASVALVYEHNAGDDLAFSASLGLDRALSVKDGLPAGDDLPTMLQAGAAVEFDGWRIGTSGQYEIDSLAGGDSWAVGVGISKEVTEQLHLGAEVAVNHYVDGGADMKETNLGLLAEYAIVPDQVSVDASFNILHRTGGGVDETIKTFGAGVSFSF